MLQPETIARVAFGALAVWMVPVIAAQFIDSWHWGVDGFLVAYLIFFATGLVYALIARQMSDWAYKAGVGLAMLVGFVLAWTTMVHASETDNPANLVYFGVLAVGGVGAALARLEARGLALAVFIMAAALAVVLTIPLALPSTPSRSLWDVRAAHGLFVGLFVVSGFLFRRASLTRF